MIENTTENHTRTKVELEIGDSATITLENGDVFVTDKYKMTDRLIMCIGYYEIGAGSEKERTKTKTLFIPFSAVRCIEVDANEVVR